uniref:Uncharacterized protein n=1 Tax=Hyaloperonospora arabidopsidis (strain Emoy2) TaxID=559515 RepID=M4BI97_HYAAE
MARSHDHGKLDGWIKSSRKKTPPHVVTFTIKRENLLLAAQARLRFAPLGVERSTDLASDEIAAFQDSYVIHLDQQTSRDWFISRKLPP